MQTYIIYYKFDSPDSETRHPAYDRFITLMENGLRDGTTSTFYVRSEDPNVINNIKRFYKNYCMSPDVPEVHITVLHVIGSDITEVYRFCREESKMVNGAEYKDFISILESENSAQS